MKKMILILLAVLTVSGSAQEKKKEVLTASFKVAGNCEQCKTRIENAADIKGVKNSSWDEKSQSLKVTYRADKVSLDKIKESVAAAGHDVEGYKAPEKVYGDLPDCCKYRDKKCETNK